MPKGLSIASVIAAIRIARPHAGLLAAIYTALGAYLSGGVQPDRLGDVVRAALVIALIVAFGFIINDWHDAAEDGLSKPYRAIPSGRLSANAAFRLALGSAALAVVLGWSIGAAAGMVALLLVVCSAAYTLYLKATLFLGIAMVAVLNAAAVLYGCLASGSFSAGAAMLIVLAFLNASAQETLYNVRDRAADARLGVRTTAVRLGSRPTLLLFSALALVCAGTTVLPWQLHLGSAAYVWLALPCSTAPLVAVVVLVHARMTDDSLELAHSVMKLARLFSVLPVLLLK